MKYLSIGINQLENIPQFMRLSNDIRNQIKAVSMVFPFRVNNYIVEELIDWDNIPNDPIFQLTFPQPDMLNKKDLCDIIELLDSSTEGHIINQLINRIREQMNPHPAFQKEMNVPHYNGKKHQGLQHKYPETVLFFPKQGQICAAYCTYCFRWAQFSGIEDMQFSASDPLELVEYIKSHPQITDVLITGGDPLSMSSNLLRRYIEPLLRKPGNLRSIRIGTKFPAFWPYRFISDKDSKDLLNLFSEIVDSGLHLAIMAHYSHFRELETEAAKKAVKIIRKTGAEIRSQSPVLNHINNNSDVWSTMWQKQTELGIIPYYMFLSRDTGAREYFKISITESVKIFTKAISRVSGLGRTVRGPVMSCAPGKILIDGITKIEGRSAFVLKFIQGRNPDWISRIFFAEFDENADWIDKLKPLNTDQFFFEEEFSEMLKQALCF